MRSNIRGPRLATKLFILMSLALVVIPWFSYLFLREMEDFLIDSQANAQLLTAEGISTLLNGHPDFIEQLPQSPEGYEQLYAHPLTTPIRIDGKSNDWEGILSYNVSFGSDSIEDTPTDGSVPNQFYLVLGEHNEQVYALLQVKDDALVFRDSNILRLDLSDHIRITFTGQNDEIKKMVVTMTEPGVTTAYMMDPDWRYALQGVAENRVQGFMTQTDDGYAIEFRIPLELLGSTKHFGLAVVDVDKPETRAIESITGTLPSAGREAFGLVLLKSPEVLRIVEGLGYSGANIQVIDAQRRVRAEVGSYQTGSLEPVTEDTGNFDRWITFFDKVVSTFYAQMDTWLRRTTNDESEDKVILDSLAGKPSYQRRYTEKEGEVIIAGHPIISENEVIGAVVLKQNTNRIQQLRQDALQRIVNFSVLSLIIFVVLILAFSVRLARRIRKLGAEATNAIDIYGRLQTNQLKSETRSGDEIGDLARSISGMLAKLHQHNQFLENMPRTLRHEINNPLNTLSTSLQNLESETSEVARSKYLESAKRGVIRISMIVQNLADAANLEDALESEELEIIDLHKLVESYLNNSKVVHSRRQFEYKGTQQEVLSRVSDYRIEQLLDKLVDNAVDFSPENSTITVGLTTDNQNLTMFVTNEGPTIPRDMIENIFDSMVSVRANSPDNRLHFGMGLYVVRVIAEHHGGSVAASNLMNGQGVTIRVTLPRFHPLADHAYAAG
ncbi:MAG: two-component system sensor histidine kinase ChvG [Candidatus Azotimanducaceae bacterium]|jgi:two-component system sensor histidine kinase ChvG